MLEMGAFLGAAFIGLAAWAADALVKPFVQGFGNGDPVMIGIILAAVGGAAMMFFGDKVPFVRPLGKGAVVAGVFLAAGSVLAPVAQKLVAGIRV